MNTEQRLNELEKRVASLERMLATNLGQVSGVPQGTNTLLESLKKKPTPEETKRVAEFLYEKGYRGNLDTTGSDPANIASVTPDNTSGSDPAGQ